MITVNVSLIVICTNIAGNQKLEFVCDVSGPPKTLIYPTETMTGSASSLDVAKELFSSCMGFSPSWVTIEQFGILERMETQEIFILYGCLIPESTELEKKSLRWLGLDEISKYNKHTQDAVVMMAANKFKGY